MSPHEGAVNLFTAGLEKEPSKPPPLMMPLIQTKIRCQLGCRLEYQGPRQATSRVAGEKSTTGFTTNVQEKKQKKSFSKDGLNILQWNAEGLGVNKPLELKKVMKDKQIHIALIQETKLRNKLPPSFPGYDIYQCDCKDPCQGLMTLIRSDMQATVSKVQTNDRNDIHHIHLWQDGRKYTIYNIYSPPNVPFDAKLQEIHFKKTILAGDTNGHSPVWGYEDTNPSGKNIEELVNSTNLILLQNKDTKPTLFHRPSGKTFRPDHTMVSADLDEDYHMEVLEDLGSDHLPIHISINTKQGGNTKKREPRWNYSKADWNSFRNATDDLFSRLDNTTSIEKQLSDFTEAILKAANCSIPKGNREKHHLIWSNELQEAINIRKKARKAAEKNPTMENKREYNICSAKTKLISRNLKKATWERKTGSLDMRKDGKKAWRLLDKLSGKNKRCNPVPFTTPTGGKATTDTKKS